MTIGFGPESDGFDPTDEHVVSRIVNQAFREGPALTELVAGEAEDLDGIPGRGADSAVDLAAAAARADYRNDGVIRDAMPQNAIPYAMPGALGVAASRPSSFALRSAPMGAEVPAEVAEPWRHMATTPWQWAERGVAEVGTTPDAASLRELEQLPGLTKRVAREPTWPSLGPAAAAEPSLYFLDRHRRVAPVPGAGRSLSDDFPALQQEVHGKRLVWLDNAATTQKPRSVIDALSHFYSRDNSNVHRGAHELAKRATDAYEGARAKVAAFLGAPEVEEIVFVRGTTEAINLVAQSYGRSVVGEGDEIVLTTLEHHSNIVPWQLLAKEKGATLRPVAIDDRGDVRLDHYASLLSPRTRVVALSHVSNALGTIVPIEAMAAMARAVGAVVVIDGAQGVPHLPVDVQALGVDFYAFSGHKLYGPTGVGALWGRRALLESMPPWQGGGSMIKTVNFESSTWNDLPYKFEAGTGTIGPAVGLGAAIDYVTAVGLPQIAAHEQALLAHGMDALGSIPGVRLIGTSVHKAGVMSFVIDGADTEAVAKYLDKEGIAVRAGHHCAQPVLRHYGLDGTVRASLGLYNTHDDIDVLARAVAGAAKKLRS